MPAKSFLEDMLTLGTGALGNLAEAQQEIKAQAKQRAGSVLRKFDIVTRDEFDAAFAMLAKTRLIQEEIAKRLSGIEAKLGLSKAKKPVKTAKKSLPSVKTKAKAKAGKTR